MPVRMTCKYVGDLRCVLTHAPSTATLETDAPVDNAGKGESFSPTDLVASALLSCALTTMAIKGAKQNIALPRCSGSIEKEMTQSGPRTIAALKMAVTLPSSVAPSDRLTLEEIARTCPVALALAPNVATTMSFIYE